eukprot:TRINITY_DN37443_c0_g1_i1.p1 TRINITY_DN37443_c0_g1~~TRINITY_DN37443_c0_g1_i1.p1  ORF type:complete len:124 (+),score=32.38 TRINITY_DN37443_c0_g1_i1:168-539(+)
MDRLELRSGQYLTLDEDKVDPSCTFEELSLSGVVEFAVEGTAKQPPSCTTLLAGMEPATLLSKEMWNSHGSATGCHCGGTPPEPCLLYTSDAADEEDSVDLGGRRIIKKKKKRIIKCTVKIIK